MDFTIDPDTVAIAEAVLRFVGREVLPLQQRQHDLLGKRTHTNPWVRRVDELNHLPRLRSRRLRGCAGDQVAQVNTRVRQC
ncbi:hypothetical protein [Polaromonas sp. JS666]|jgi:acyl-CoA dehydrogenase|uniref:hypothetical protein n=1 Tax=Polaromonas sp. (strain JS666 / ATCC BAA-500) TaxID=296591 RepID=UPI00004646EB|nr:hypothetical protein [Polaromonas sp. JS666]